MHIDHINEANIDATLKNAWDKACLLFSPAEDETLLQNIINFINRSDVRPFFYLPENARVFCEKEFVNKYGDTKRIDRLIILENEVQIIDFKLSPGAEGEHQKQIDSYVDLVKQFYPKHKVTGQILFLQEQGQG